MDKLLKKYYNIRKKISRNPHKYLDLYSLFHFFLEYFCINSTHL